MTFPTLIAQYGAFFIAVIIALECVGAPLPGETTLIFAAIYAGTKHDLGIGTVIGAAIVGAVVGNIAGYYLGRELGHRLLVRYGRYVGLTETRLKIGRYLFMRHGTKAVFIARFIVVLRSVAGILAGANSMPLRPFMVANVAGAVVWATAYGVAGYLLGDELQRLAGPAVVVLGGVAVAVLVASFVLVARHEQRLAAEAERAIPGPP
jgi:membrane protein DedA with SNARE-associated domain